MDLRNTCLPDEVMLNIIMNADYPTLMRFCKINRRSHNLCNDIIFWRDKLSYDYDIRTRDINDSRHVYDSLYRKLSFPNEAFRLIDVYYHELGKGDKRRIGQIIITEYEKEFGVINDAVNLIETTGQLFTYNIDIWFIEKGFGKSTVVSYDDYLTWKQDKPNEIMKNRLRTKIGFDLLESILIEKERSTIYMFQRAV